MKKNRGATLIVLIIFLFIFVIIAAALQRLLRTRIYAAVYNSKVQQSLNAAEGGIEDAVQKLVDNPSWVSGFTNKTFVKGRYSVIIATYPGVRRIISKGEVPAMTPSGMMVHRTVEVSVDVSQSTETPAAFGYAVAGETVNISSATVTGDVYEGDLDILGLPWVDDSKYKEESLVGGTHVGDLVINNSSVGPLYITGGLILRNNVTINGTVYAEGEIRIKPNGDVSGGNTLFTNDDVHVGGHAQVSDIFFILGKPSHLFMVAEDVVMNHVGIYAAESNINIAENSSILGFVVGEVVHLADDSFVGVG